MRSKLFTRIHYATAAATDADGDATAIYRSFYANRKHRTHTMTPFFPPALRLIIKLIN